MNYRITLLTAALLSAASGAWAQGTEGRGSATRTDHIGGHEAGLTAQQFANEAGAGGLAEVQLSQMALNKSTNPEIKQFAQMMIADHGKTNNELVALAGSKKLDVPTTIKPEQQAAAEKLSKESGSAFDRAYAAQMVDDHRKAVDLFRKATREDTLEADIRQFAEKKLATLEHHQKEAIELAASMREDRQSSR